MHQEVTLAFSHDESTTTEPIKPEVVGTAAGGDDTSLEYFHNVLTEPIRLPDHVEIRKCGCNSWYCEDCAKRRGYALRAELVPILESFTGLLLITLTVDPTLFNSPLDALMYIREKTCIGVLMQKLHRAGHLHTRRYFNILEFQKNGHPHYHMLLDASFIPKNILQQSWDSFRPTHLPQPEGKRPGFGATWISVGNFEGGAIHAARYATKYLVKIPDHGFPDWVLQLGESIRVPRYSCSKKFWERPSKPQKKTKRPKKRRASYSYAMRHEQCGSTSNLFNVQSWLHEDGTTDEKRIWLARVGLSTDLYAAIDDLHDPKTRWACVDPIQNQSPIEAITQAIGHPVPVLAVSKTAGVANGKA